MDGQTKMLPVYLPAQGDGREGRVFKIEVDSTAYSGETDIDTRLPSFEGVLDTVEELAAAFASTLQRAGPRRASIELGVDVAVESGQLTALLVKGSAKANLVIKLEWGP
jgi:hypothetical protein